MKLTTHLFKNHIVIVKGMIIENIFKERSFHCSLKTFSQKHDISSYEDLNKTSHDLGKA